MAWPATHFGAALNFHVAMNIFDRPRLLCGGCTRAAPGAIVGSYDVLEGPAKGMLFPVPRAGTRRCVILCARRKWSHCCKTLTFEVAHQEDRREIAI
jgi:hypothetical protein